jgi:hypothetical protein
MFTAKSFMVRAAAVTLVILPVASAFAADERQSLEELRNTVINLLQGLVEQGVLTREKAAQMVKAAQEKAAADAAALAKADEGAVRVPYVPQIVKDEISKQVAESLKPAVVADVVKEAKAEKWGVPGAMPDWLSRVRVTGDVRLRAEDILFSRDNLENFYIDFFTVNSRGGVAKAGPAAFLNVSEDRLRLRARARFGVEADLSSSFKAGIRLATGNTTDPGSENQTLGVTGARYNIGVDQAYIRLDERTPGQFAWLSAVGGRFASPWLAPTDLIYHKDLAFEGVAVTGRLGFGDQSAEQSHVFLTVGAFPIQEIELSKKDKWLLGAQLGANLRFGDDQRLRIGAALYDFRNVQGRQNTLDSNLLDYTAPQFLRIGNTLFDIRNDNDVTTNLFALASKYRLVNLSATYDVPFGRYSLGAALDAVKNIGFKSSDVFALTGAKVAARTKGYQAELSFGYPKVTGAGAWRGLLGYRYVERDAVLDAFTDSDFHGGGTDASGFYLIGDYGLSNRVWMRLRYQSGNEIDGAPLGVDTVQLDLNTQF